MFAGCRGSRDLCDRSHEDAEQFDCCETGKGNNILSNAGLGHLGWDLAAIYKNKNSSFNNFGIVKNTISFKMATHEKILRILVSFDSGWPWLC